jgi:hypothetical protein
VSLGGREERRKGLKESGSLQAQGPRGGEISAGKTPKDTGRGPRVCPCDRGRNGKKRG